MQSFNKQALEDKEVFQLPDLFNLSPDNLKALGEEAGQLMEVKKPKNVVEMIMIVHDLIDAQPDLTEAQKALTLYILLHNGLNQEEDDQS